MVPNLLIIGAMKSATTTLYDLLAAHPHICGTEVKEPAFLVPGRHSDGKCLELYGRLFARVRNARYRLEGSTGYTMRPRIDGCAERARRLLGPDLRILYMVREPLGRIRSHYTHLARTGRASGEFEETVRSEPSLISFSRYHHQIEPWVEIFGKERVRLIEFGRFTRDAGPELESIRSFLRLDEPFPLKDGASNVGSKLPRLPSWINGIQRSGFYKTRLAPLLPRGLKQGMTRALGRAPSRIRADYTPAFASWILEQLREDYARLVPLLPFAPEDRATVWNFQRLIESYAAPPSPTESG